MKIMNHRLTAAAAALLFTSSAAVAQLNSTLHGAMNASGGVADRPMGSPPAGVGHGPAAGASGADVNTGARGLSMAADQSLTATAALDMTDTIHAINSATLAARQSLLGDINARMEASGHAMADLSERARMLRADAQAEFRVAVKDVHAKEKALKRSVKKADKAKAEAWGETRADLAVHYDAYAEAVAHAEAVAFALETPAHAAEHEGHAMPMASAGADGNARGQASAGTNR